MHRGVTPLPCSVESDSLKWLTYAEEDIEVTQALCFKSSGL
jgi:hypothetical protein